MLYFHLRAEIIASELLKYQLIAVAQCGMSAMLQSILLLLLGVSLGENSSLRSTCSKTPKNLPDQFESQCLVIVGDKGTCDDGWNAFTSAFAGRDPSTVIARCVHVATNSKGQLINFKPFGSSALSPDSIT